MSVHEGIAPFKSVLTVLLRHASQSQLSDLFQNIIRPALQRVSDLTSSSPSESPIGKSVNSTAAGNMTDSNDTNDNSNNSRYNISNHTNNNNNSNNNSNIKLNIHNDVDGHQNLLNMSTLNDSNHDHLPNSVVASLNISIDSAEAENDGIIEKTVKKTCPKVPRINLHSCSMNNIYNNSQIMSNMSRNSSSNNILHTATDVNNYNICDINNRNNNNNNSFSNNSNNSNSNRESVICLIDDSDDDSDDDDDSNDDNRNNDNGDDHYDENNNDNYER